MKQMFLDVSILMIFFILPPEAGTTLKEETAKSSSAFPILMYGTDIGIGYGGKAKFVNYLSKKESEVPPKIK